MTSPIPGQPNAALDESAAVTLGESFDAFYVREFPGLVAVAYGLSGSRTHAEDLAQEAMIAAYRKWGRISGYEAPAAWVRRVCLNLATSHFRRRSVEARAMLRLRGRRFEPAELDADDSGYWAEVRRLPRRQAQAVALRYVLDCPIAEIADVLGCSEGTVKTHLSRARLSLAARLNSPEGMTSQ